MHVGMAQIDVHQQDPLARARGEGGEAQGQGGLAFLRQGGGDQDHPRRVVDVGELQRGVDRADRIRRRPRAAWPADTGAASDCAAGARAAARGPAPAGPASARPGARCAGRCRSAPSTAPAACPSISEAVKPTAPNSFGPGRARRGRRCRGRHHLRVGLDQLAADRRSPCSARGTSCRCCATRRRPAPARAA